MAGSLKKIAREGNRSLEADKPEVDTRKALTLEKVQTRSSLKDDVLPDDRQHEGSNRGETEMTLLRQVLTEIAGLKKGLTELRISADTVKIEKFRDEIHTQNKKILSLEGKIGSLETTFTSSFNSLKEQLHTQLASTQSISEKMVNSTLPDVISEIDTKLKSYAAVTQSAQAELLDERDEELRAQQQRKLNCRIASIVEEDTEDTVAVVRKFLTEDLKVVSPAIHQAYRVGKVTGKRPIIVKFVASEDRELALSNRAMLKGLQIWIDSDMTPLQAESKRRELDKVKSARDDGWVAYLRDGRAVVTTRKLSA